jgi:hypothetical protein
MSPSPEPLLTIWTDLNRRYFQGTLPPIPIEWSRRLTSSAGMFVCRIGPRQPLARTTEAPTRRRCIRLSAVLLKPNNPGAEPRNRHDPGARNDSPVAVRYLEASPEPWADFVA